MSKIVGVLFPWRKTFKRLELAKRWWHRLAIVLLSIALIIAFLFSWAIAEDAIAPTYSFDQDIHHWQSPMERCMTLIHSNRSLILHNLHNHLLPRFKRP
jgi:hypothetical protein